MVNLFSRIMERWWCVHLSGLLENGSMFFMPNLDPLFPLIFREFVLVKNSEKHIKNVKKKLALHLAVARIACLNAKCHDAKCQDHIKLLHNLM